MSTSHTTIILPEILLTNSPLSGARRAKASTIFGIAAGPRCAPCSQCAKPEPMCPVSYGERYGDWCQERLQLCSRERARGAGTRRGDRGPRRAAHAARAREGARARGGAAARVHGDVAPRAGGPGAQQRRAGGDPTDERWAYAHYVFQGPPLFIPLAFIPCAALRTGAHAPPLPTLTATTFVVFKYIFVPA